MKVKLLAPVIYQEHLYRQGAVVDVSPLEGVKWVHDKVAIPEPDAPRKQVIYPPEMRQCVNHD